ncbi:MAG: hypothetical protein JW795_14110, partial [Chitinivibrionales bacterium]|nr:hypothetical protein [Chitinivibrionales bacterium]
MFSHEVTVHIKDTGSSATMLLADAWVYWKKENDITILRTDSAGKLKKLKLQGDKTLPWDYTDEFKSDTPSQASVFYSTAAKPLPLPILKENSDAFTPLTVDVSAKGTVLINMLTELFLSQTAVITLPKNVCSFCKPLECSLWPLLKESFSPKYHTDGLNQGAAFWSVGNVNENSPTPPAGAGVRPVLRGLRIDGLIDARTAAVKISVVNESGATIQLRQNATATAPVTEITAVLEPATTAAGENPFSAILYFHTPAEALGPVQIIARADGVTPRILADCFVHLCGLNITLVNDFSGNPSGQQRGRILGESDESAVVDFLASPQASKAAISRQTRCRRMVVHWMESRQRQLSVTNPSLVMKPEMPLWMVEGQIIGISRKQLEDLMVRRKKCLPGAPTSLVFDWNFVLKLNWDGPDSATNSNRRYRYDQTFSHNLHATLKINDEGRISGDAAGEVAQAFAPQQSPIDFPVAGRRRPQVVVA